MIRTNVVRALIIFLLASAAGLAWVLYQVGSASDLLLLIKTPPLALGAATAFLLLSFGLSAYRLMLICRRFGLELRARHALRAHILAVFSTTVTPGGSGGYILFKRQALKDV